ncbi:alpha/beta hydrolase [Marinobacteraceae bacterium S3BR75-40.1]
MPSVELSTGTVHYIDRGRGTPVILLHANPGDSQDYEAVIPALARRCRVLAPDWPGYGLSSLLRCPDTVDVHLYYHTLREFVSALDLAPVVLVGNSMGGNAAARLAFESPELVKGLVLVSPGGFSPDSVLKSGFCRWQGSPWSISPYRFARFYLKHFTPVTEGMLKRASTLQATGDRLAVNRAVWRSFAEPKNDLRQSARHIKSPTLLLFGKRDPVVPASRDGRIAARAIPRALFIELPCGHAPFAEVPGLFLANVQPFLATCERMTRPALAARS